MTDGMEPLEGKRRDRRGWLSLTLLLLAVILIPFALFAGIFDSAVDMVRGTVENHPAVFGLVVILLILDVLLPIPSSVVLVFSGYGLGFIWGWFAGWLGLMGGLLFGHWLGRQSADLIGRRVLGEDRREELEQAMKRWGVWVIAVTRAIPVLAEATAYLSGVSRFPLRTTLVAGALANGGLALVMAAAGAFSADTDNLLAAFLASIVLPALAMLLWRLFRPRDPR